MYVYNWLPFGTNPIQDGHHIQLSLKNTKNGYNSVNVTNMELESDVVVAASHLEHIPLLY